MSPTEYMRMKIFSELSDEEKRAYMRHKEMMGAFQSLNEKVDASRHSFLQDFGANVAGNAVWDGAVWLASKLIKNYKCLSI